jgi:hypothetical protein
MEKLGQALQAPPGGTPGDARSAPNAPGAGLTQALMARDERTGQPYLRLPMPQPEVLQGIAALLGKLAGTLK